MTTDVYAMRAGANTNEFTITKLTKDLEFLASYTMTRSTCTCPHGSAGGWCKHLKVFGLFFNSGHIGDGYYLDLATRQWIDPLYNKRELDGLEIGGPRPFVLGQTPEEKLVEVVAPALEQESTPKAAQGEFKIQRRRL